MNWGAACSGSPAPVSQFLPPRYLFRASPQIVLFTFEPESKPIKISQVNLVFVFRLISHVAFVGIDPQFYWFSKFLERNNSRQIGYVLGIGRVFEDRRIHPVRS